MKRAPKIRCARCEARLADPSKRLYSRFTKKHFCADIEACTRRVRRKPVTRAPQTKDEFLALIREDAAGCWIWQGRITTIGYGGVGRTGYAHRVAYELFVGPIPDGLVIDHLCEIRACVNPAHLRPLTINENASRSPNYPSNRSHCPRGHEYTTENTIQTRRGRLCRECNRVKCAARYERVRIRQVPA